MALPTDRPVYQAEIEAEIIRLLGEIENEVLPQLAQISEEASIAEVKYKVEHAKAYLKAQGPTATRNAHAVVESGDQLLDRVITDRGVTTVREKLHAYEASIDALRTLLVGTRNQT